MSKASDTTLHNLTVKPASEAQRHEVVLRNAAHWGAKAGIDTDTFLRLCAIIEAGEYARDGKQTTWLAIVPIYITRMLRLGQGARSEG